MAFITETQIANRALQRCGAGEIADGLLWTENSRNAAEIRKTWDISRRYELRRNVWRFAIRTQVLRPIETTDKLVTWPAFVSVLLTDYAINDIVLGSDGRYWIATAAQTGPALDPTARTFAKWTNFFGPQLASLYSSTTSYMAGELVYSGSTVYMSLQNNNEGNTLVTAAYWYNFPHQPTTALFTFIYPIGAGPFSDAQTLNVYKLPYGFLRQASASPRQGSYTSLGAPTNLPYTDQNFEGDYFTTAGTGATALRFAADLEDPTLFDAMFVDAFACRIGLDVAEVLTQSSSKLDVIGKLYLKFMSEARLVNGIETGPEEAPLDDYLACRI